MSQVALRLRRQTQRIGQLNMYATCHALEQHARAASVLVGWHSGSCDISVDAVLELLTVGMRSRYSYRELQPRQVPGDRSAVNAKLTSGIGISLSLRPPAWRRPSLKGDFFPRNQLITSWLLSSSGLLQRTMMVSLT